MRAVNLATTFLLAGLALSPCAAQPAGPRAAAATVRLSGQAVSIYGPVQDGDATVDVVLGADRFTVTIGPERGVLPALSGYLRMEGGYLFVRADCGCTANWAAISHVFAVRNGRLVHIGAATDNWDDAARVPGVYTLLDNQLGLTGLTDNAGTPMVIVPLHEVLGHFRFDPARCWAVNHGEYEKARAELQGLRGAAHHDERPRTDLLYMAGVDRYCGRRDALAADFATAQGMLSAHELAALHKEIEAMVVGKLPDDL